MDEKLRGELKDILLSPPFTEQELPSGARIGYIDIPKQIEQIEQAFKDADYEKLPSVPIVCLCGSTRFVGTYNYWRQKLTCEGKVVLSIEIVTTQTKDNDPQHCNPELKQKLDELHLRKIDLATEVMILNVGGYIGESTAKEIKYAESIGKKIVYLE